MQWQVGFVSVVVNGLYLLLLMANIGVVNAATNYPFLLMVGEAEEVNAVRYVNGIHFITENVRVVVLLSEKWLKRSYNNGQ